MINDWKVIKLAGLAAISLIFLGLYFHLDWSRGAESRVEPHEFQAARLMAEACRLILECQENRGILPEDNEFDRNRTGLIGLENSPLTTTLGNLQAKRTTTNPDFAALIVHLLKKAGVRRGEVVAMGASGSFPALIVACYAAARALDLELLAIISIGASQWGANNPEFSWLEMEDCLQRSGFNQHRLLALTWGGEDDSGKEYPEELRSRLLKTAAALNLKFLETGSLEERVRQHLNLFQAAACGRQIRAFINIGGSSVNLGQDSSILELQPGLVRVGYIPPGSRRGLIQEMARLGVPVIHLLNIRRLAEIYNLPWDPEPLPEPAGRIHRPEGSLQKSEMLVILAALILSGIIWLVLIEFIRKKLCRRERPQDF